MFNRGQPKGYPLIFFTMKTQTFIVEITTPKFDKPIKDYEILAALDSGLGFPDWKITAKEESND